MRALCPQCGFHHEVVHVLDDGRGESRRDVYQVAALPDCPQTWLSETDVLDAAARYGREAIVQEDADDIP